MKNLTLLGTSHIAKESINKIKEIVDEEKPDIIALELDIQRAASLIQEEKRKMSLATISKIGFKGYLFARIGQFAQKKLGKMVRVAPGSEMKTAMVLAKKKNLEIAFIDQPMQITLKKFSKSLTWKEKLRFIKDIFRGIFSPRKQLRKLGLEKFDLSKVPKEEMINKMMQELKNNYPSIYKTLVEDRNKYMVKSLVKLMRKNPNKKILAVVGAGHKKGMGKLLLKVDVIR